MDEATSKKIAQQLRQPTGEEGIKTGEWMNRGNHHINLDTIEIIAAGADEKILEIGMGNGFFVKNILQKNHNVHYTGVDFSEVMIAEAKKINEEWIEKKQADFILCDIDNMPFQKESFHKIFTINTIYFWENVENALATFKKILKPSGQLTIAIRPKHLMDNYPFTRYGFTMYNKQELEQLLLQNNFLIVNTKEIKEPDFEIEGKVINVESLIVTATPK